MHDARTSGTAAPPPSLLTDFCQPFEQELGVIEDLQLRVLATPPGDALLATLGELEMALAALARPAAFFSSRHPDAGQANAAAALLQVCRLAAAQTYSDPRVRGALLTTAAQLLRVAGAGPGAGTGDGILQARAEAAERGAARVAGCGPPPGVATITAAAAALDDALAAHGTEFSGDGGGGGSSRFDDYGAGGSSSCDTGSNGQSDDASGSADVAGRLPYLLLACRHALQAAAVALSEEVCVVGGGDPGGSGGSSGSSSGGGIAHPYQGNSAAGSLVAQPDNKLDSRANFTGSIGSTRGVSRLQAAVDEAAAAFAQLSRDPRLSPVILMTEGQAALVEPLLRDGGLAPRVWPPLVRGNLAGVPRAARLRCSRRLRVAQGPGGWVELTGLVSATDAARDLLAHHGALPSSSAAADGAADGDAEGGSSGGGGLPERGAIDVPAAASLRALVATRDVAFLLLRQHPNPDVRRLVHSAGLAPRHRLLLCALSALAARRAAAAAARGAPSHLAAMLREGGLLREPAAVESLLVALSRGVAPYAASDLRALGAEAGRRRLAAGRQAAQGGGGSSSCEELEEGFVAEWDAEYRIQGAAAAVASGVAWRDFADHFTLPELWRGLDRLLHEALGLRLLPAPPGSSKQAWGAHVTHLQLWDDDPPESVGDAATGAGVGSAGGGPGRKFSPGGGARGAASRAGTINCSSTVAAGALLLGDVFVEVAPPGGFPFTTLLRPSSRPAAWGLAWGSSRTSRCSGGGPAFVPGAVVVHLPLMLSGAGGGSDTGVGADHDPAPPGRPPALGGPFGLRAALHELGHACALLAACAAAPHPLLAASGAAAGAGGCGGVELRELPSHLMEGWAADPRALALMSRHWSLGSPLGPRDAGRLARYGLSAAAGSSLELHEALLLAAADARLHALGPEAFSAEQGDDGGGGDGSGCGSSSFGAGAAGGASTLCVAQRVFGAVWSELGVLPFGASLEAMRGLEALGSLGGMQWGYATARLLAAAARKRWLTGGGGGPGGLAAGRELKSRLLYGLGRGLPPQALLTGLLGRGSLARVEVAPAADDWLAGGEGGVDSAPGRGPGHFGVSSGKRVCWIPDVYAPAFQDLDLLG